MNAVDMQHYYLAAWFRGERQYKRYGFGRAYASVLYLLLDGIRHQCSGLLYTAFCVPGAKALFQCSGRLENLMT